VSRIHELEKAVVKATPEEELVQVFSHTLRAAFPGARYCVRTVDPETCAVRCLCAEGTLLPGARERLRIKRHAAAKTGLRIPAHDGKVELTDSYHPVFDGGWDGTCAPIVTGGVLYGAVNLEKPSPLTDREKLLLIVLANQMAFSLKAIRGLSQTVERATFVERALQGASALVLVTDVRRRIRYINAAAAELAGRTPADVVGSDILDWFPKASHMALKRIVVATVRGRNVVDAPLVIRDRDGRETALLVSTAPVFDEDGEVEGMVATARVNERHG
jgi:PAS domain S-box-containing protein